VLWLTGGLRRAAIASAFLERLTSHHTVIAPDYPPVLTIGEFLAAFDGILHAESVESVALGASPMVVLLAHVLPEQKLKESVSIGLVRLIGQLPRRERIEMADLIRAIVSQELCRADVVSHFAVAADVIRTKIVTPACRVPGVKWCRRGVECCERPNAKQ
jgi:hypothetical protein